MTTIIGTGEVGALHSREELEEMQRLPLQRKIQITTARIIEWYQHYDGKVYVAFSGGWVRASSAYQPDKQDPFRWAVWKN